MTAGATLKLWQQFALIISTSVCCYFSYSLNANAQAGSAQSGNNPPAQVLISKQVTDGKVEWLTSGDSTALAIYKNAKRNKANGTILLLSDTQSNANEPELIGPLRRILPKSNWATLALSIATDKKKALSTVAAGWQYLQKNGNKTPILLSYSRSAEFAVEYLQQQQDAAQQVLVLISANSQKPTELADALEKLLQNKTKILDIIAAHDFSNILQQAKQRQDRLKKYPNYYRQIEIFGADHYYSQLQTQLVKKIHSWLTRTNR